MAKKGDRVISENDIITILDEEGIATACRVGRRLKKNYVTARKRLEELVDSGKVERLRYNPRKNTMRLYQLRDENELEQTTHPVE